MTSRIRLALAAAVAALPFCVAPAIAAPSSDQGVARAAIHVNPTGPDAARVQAVLAEADALEGAGRVGEARKKYRALIDEQRQSDQYPSLALWRLANSYFYHDDEARTAQVLDELAESAAHFGDPTMELRASFEAAVIYQHAKASDKVAAKLSRVQALLKSPAIADETKKEIQGRLVS
jgi:hypothetical protein